MYIHANLGTWGIYTFSSFRNADNYIPSQRFTRQSVA